MHLHKAENHTLFGWIYFTVYEIHNGQPAKLVHRHNATQYPGKFRADCIAVHLWMAAI